MENFSQKRIAQGIDLLSRKVSSETKNSSSSFTYSYPIPTTCEVNFISLSPVDSPLDARLWEINGKLRIQKAQQINFTLLVFEDLTVKQLDFDSDSGLKATLRGMFTSDVFKKMLKSYFNQYNWF